jgi:hypothetical protein
MGSGGVLEKILNTGAGLSLLGCVLCAGLFVHGLVSGLAPGNSHFDQSLVSQAGHPLGFFAYEAFWLLAAAGWGIHGLKELGKEWPGAAAAAGKPNQEQTGAVFAARVTRPARPAAPVAARQPMDKAAQSAEPEEFDNRELRLVSRDGRYVLYVHPEEMNGGELAFTPEMVDGTTGRVLFYPRQRGWTLDTAVWQTASLLAMRLRRYPGDPAPIGATFDCASGAAHIDGIPVDPFTNTSRMEEALREVYEAGAPQPAV